MPTRSRRALTGYFFEKSVENLTTGISPAPTATPGDRLRYTLRLRTTDTPVNNVTFYDELDELNGLPAFVPGTLALVTGTIPAGADTSGTNPTGGANGTGIVEIGNLSVPADSEVLVQFDITLAAVLTNGLVVTNQADLLGNTKLADSDDPNINGPVQPERRRR